MEKYIKCNVLSNVCSVLERLKTMLCIVWLSLRRLGSINMILNQTVNFINHCCCSSISIYTVRTKSKCITFSSLFDRYLCSKLKSKQSSVQHLYNMHNSDQILQPNCSKNVITSNRGHLTQTKVCSILQFDGIRTCIFGSFNSVQTSWSGIIIVNCAHLKIVRVIPLNEDTV